MITGHLEAAQNEFQWYFLELAEKANFVRNPFSLHLDIANIPHE